jgi:hypothetical protein
MRVLFLSLVLANFAFAAWHAWFSAPSVPTRPIRTNAPSIRLYAEADVPSDPVRAENTDVASAQMLPVCISVGPFPNRVDVSDAAGDLSDAGFSSTQRTADGDVWLGYWVYLDAIETQALANDIVERLSEAGISEAYVIADGNNGSIVSLGVFSERTRSEQRFSEVQALGLEPVVANRFQPGEVFWLDVRARDGRSFDAAELPNIEVDPELQTRACPSGSL